MLHSKRNVIFHHITKQDVSHRYQTLRRGLLLSHLHSCCPVDSAAESSNSTLGKLVQWESKNSMWSHSIISSFKKNVTNKGLWFLKHAYCEWTWNSGKKILDFLSDRLCLMTSAKDTGVQVRAQGIWSQTDSCLDAVGYQTSKTSVPLSTTVRLLLYQVHEPL